MRSLQGGHPPSASPAAIAIRNSAGGKMRERGSRVAEVVIATVVRRLAPRFYSVTAKLTPLGFGLDGLGPLLFQFFETSARPMTKAIEQLQALLCFQKISMG
jgi:hypothetical protein